MKNFINKVILNETTTAISLIFLTTLITYGLHLSHLGYYHDDWYLLWSGAARGAASIIPLFESDRPFMGVIYSQVYRLLGDTVLYWHLYALLWRFLGALAFFWMTRLLWPRQRYLASVATILFLVYPGFLSQPDANTKQNHLFGFSSALFSIALMLQATRLHSRWKQTVLVVISLVLTANYLLIYEYMIGFEGTRLLLLGYILFKDGIQQGRVLAKEIFKRWWPYILVTAGFVYWRLFIFSSNRNATDAGQLADGYLGNLRYLTARLTIGTLKDFLDTSIFAWFVKPYLMMSSAQYSELAWAMLSAAFVVALIWLYSLAYSKWWGTPDQEMVLPKLSREVLWIGALITLFAVFPVILSGREVQLTDAYKSYGLHPMSGVVLFVTGILMMFNPNMRRAAVVVLIFLSVTAQVLNANRWERFWNYERSTWWQLTWRAPDIQDDTLVMTYFFDDYLLQQDYEIWGPINLIYRPGLAESPAISAEVLTGDTAYNVLRGDIKDNHMRDIGLHRNYNNLLLLSMPSPNSCMHVIDGSLPLYSENDSLLIRQVGAFSHPERIILSGEAPTPPANIFGPEPAQNWCYYYQKASLARQRGAWGEISKLYEQVRSHDLQPGDQSEWVPYFEGLVNHGQFDQARSLFQKEFKGREKLRYPFCLSLANYQDQPVDMGYNLEMVRSIMCNQ